MASLLDKVKKEMVSKSLTPRSAEARTWLYKKISTITNPRRRLIGDASRAENPDSIIIGRMYFFYYDPKHKETLPVYDRYPLVLPIEIYNDGFLGLNLHYLDVQTRLYLLDQLHDYITNTKYDQTTRFKLSYNLLSKSARRFKLLQNCIKRYLAPHIMSNMIHIEPESWEIAIWLPTEKMVYKK